MIIPKKVMECRTKVRGSMDNNMPLLLSNNRKEPSGRFYPTKSVVTKA